MRLDSDPNQDRAVPVLHGIELGQRPMSEAMQSSYVGREVDTSLRAGGFHAPESTWDGTRSDMRPEAGPEGAVVEDWRKVKRAVFARHSNPWSAWTRWGAHH